MNKTMHKSLSKLGMTLLLAFAMLTVVAVPVAEATQGFPLYSWGNNDNGQLGLGDTTNRSVPYRVGSASNWVHVSAGANGTHAINADGELFAWGAEWNAPNMGQGGINPDVGNILTTPTRIGNASNWVYSSSRSSAVSAVNSNGELFAWGNGIGDGANTPVQIGSATNWISTTCLSTAAFAINDQGHLYSWATSAVSILGRNTSIVPHNMPGRVGDRSDWVRVSASPTSAIGITEGGYLYSWGANENGQLGQGNTLELSVPTRVGNAANWADIGVLTGNTAAAINSNGELFTWGGATNGRLGNGTSTGNVLSPTQIGNATNWVSLTSANGHFLAFNSDGELWGWGTGGSGRIGDGATANRHVPTFILQSFGFSGSSRGGGARSFMLLNTVPVRNSDDATLEKRLQKPEGTPIPSPGVTFTFNFERHSFNNNAALTAQVPQIPTRTITINSSGTSTTTGGIVTTRNSIDALDDIEFTQPGVFVWRVTEAQSATGIGPNSTVVFSQAEYEMRVYVSSRPAAIGYELRVENVNIYRIRNTAGQIVTPALKVNELSFLNSYTYTIVGTSESPALFFSKTTTGTYANLTTLFPFNGTLTIPALAMQTTPPFAGPVTAVITDSAGNVLPGRDVTVSGVLPNLTFSGQIRDGERIAFPTLPAGTVFNVTETQNAAHSAHAVITLGGTAISPNPSAIQGANLSVGPHIVHGTLPNSAAFVNTHHAPPLTGLTIQNAIPILVALTIVLPLAYFATRRREAIEKLPVLN